MADFKCIFKGLPGAEGPVFDVDGNFYAVAPEIEEAGRFRGQLFHLDLTNKSVSVLDITQRCHHYFLVVTYILC